MAMLQYPWKTLEIDAGARLHFHRNSGIIVANQASLQANGLASSDPTTLENEIIFQVIDWNQTLQISLDNGVRYGLPMEVQITF